ASGSTTYFVGVSSSGNSTGIYALTVTDLAARFVTASVLSGTGQELPHETLGAGGVTDYSLPPQQAELFVASVSPPAGSSFQPRLTLYDGAGELLIQSDQHSPGVPGAEVDQHVQ